MPKVLRPADLLLLNQTLVVGGAKALYASVTLRGFGYVHWAASVAYHLGLGKVSPADYLRGPVLMGVTESIRRVLDPMQLEKLRIDLAKSYLRVLQRLMQASDQACIERDIEVDELRELHAEGLERNGLSIENWNLHFPLVILERHVGAQGPQIFWNYFRDSRRRPVHAGLVANLALLAFIHRQAESLDIKCRQMACTWISRNPVLYSSTEIDKKLRSAISAMRAELSPELSDFLRLLDLPDHINSEIINGTVSRTRFIRRAFASTRELEARDSTQCGTDQATAAIYDALIRRLTAQ